MIFHFKLNLFQDLDWEYPANRDTEDRPDDKIYFTMLCKDLFAAFRQHGLLLTAAVAAGSKFIHSAYEIGEIHKYLSFINLMSYGKWSNNNINHIIQNNSNYWLLIFF